MGRQQSEMTPAAERQIAVRRTGGRAALAGSFLLAALALTPAPALAGAVTYTPVTTTVNGLDMTIFTKPTDNGGALRITSMGKQLWFGEHDTGDIVRFTTAGVGKFFAIPSSGAVPLAITRGPDNKIWFTIWNQALIGNVTPAGVFTLFSTGTAQTLSNDIVKGPDGNLWFVTDRMGLGRTTTAGVTQFFSTLTDSSQTTGLAVGPDKNMWYVQCCQSMPQVGRMATDGSGVTQFDVGFATQSFSFGIASDHGRIWFCDPVHRRIGRIDVNGAGLTFFDVGLTGDPQAIIAGPDGNLYFGETQSQIGRISPTGTITEFAIPGDAGTTNFPVLGLTIGPDKNIWFANNAHSQIGMLNLTPPAVEAAP